MRLVQDQIELRHNAQTKSFNVCVALPPAMSSRTLSPINQLNRILCGYFESLLAKRCHCECALPCNEPTDLISHEEREHVAGSSSILDRQTTQQPARDTHNKQGIIARGGIRIVRGAQGKVVLECLGSSVRQCSSLQQPAGDTRNTNSSITPGGCRNHKLWTTRVKSIKFLYSNPGIESYRLVYVWVLLEGGGSRDFLDPPPKIYWVTPTKI